MSTIIGTDAPDLLTGTSDAERIDGLAGDDTLHGHADDTLFGGEGADAFLAIGAGTSVADFEAGDLLVFADAGRPVSVAYDHEAGLTRLFQAAAVPTGDFLDVPGPTELVVHGLFGALGVTETSLGLAFSVWDGASDALLTAGHGGTVVAAGGDDSLYGSNGDDALHGAAGADALDGGDGHDLLLGGAGSDLIMGGAGADLIYGDSDGAAGG